MANPKYIEAIRLVLETAGDDQLQALIAQFNELGTVSDAEGAAVQRVLDNIAASSEKMAKIEAFAKLKRDLVAAESELDRAQAAVNALFAEFKGGDTSSAEIVKIQKVAVETAKKYRDAAESQRLAVTKARQELAAMGVQTQRLGQDEAALRKEFSAARGELSNLTDTITKARAATVDLAARRADFSRFLGDGRDLSEEAASALADYRRKVQEAASAQSGFAGKSGGFLSSLRSMQGVLAGLGVYLGFREAAGGVVNLLKVAAASESAQRSLANLYGSQAAGNRAFADLKQLAKQNGLAFQDIVDQAKKLKAFGLDPLNGSLQALIDQNAAVGGSQQDLEGKVLALGQAWAKQKLQGEEILQLVERGVPVWSLLEKATGLNVTQLQKLSEQGKLGRDTIKALYEEIGKANAGAAQQGLSSLSGLFAQLQARWTDFLNKVADSGVTEYFKQQIQSLLGSTGNLDVIAGRVSAGIISTVEALKNFGREMLPAISLLKDFTLTIATHANAIIGLAKVYYGIKLVNFVSGLSASVLEMTRLTAATAEAAGAAGSATGKIAGLRGALAAIPRNLQIGIAVAGVEYAVSQAIRLNEAIKEYQATMAQVDAFERSVAMAGQERLALGKQLQTLYANYASVVIKSTQEVGALTRTQAEEYQLALKSALAYYGGVIRAARETGNAQQEATATERWKELKAAVADVDQQLSQLAKTAAEQNALAEFVNRAVAGFDALRSKGESAAKAVDGIFKGVNFASPKGLQDAVGIIDQISMRSASAGQAVRDELHKALIGVAEEDLPALQSAAAAALGTGSEGAKAFAAELDKINLSRLGVDVEAIQTGFTRAGRAVTNQFAGAVREVQRLGLTAEQRSQAIAQAFDKAFQQASTSKELETLRKSLQDALSGGSIDTAAFGQRLGQIKAKLAELANASKAAPEALNKALPEAIDHLDNLGTKAREAAKDVEKIGDAGQKAADGVGAADSAARSLTTSISGVSEEFIRLIRTQNNLQLGNAFRAQQADLYAAIKATQDLNAEFDDFAAKRKELEKKYNLIDPAVVDQLVQAEKTLEQNRQRRAEAEQKAADEAKKKADAALAEARKLEAERAAAGLTTIQKIVVEVVVGSSAASALSNGDGLDPIASRTIARAVIREIGRSRSISLLPGGRR